MTAEIRRARPGDLTGLVGLMREHAAFELAAPPSEDLGDRLPSVLFGDSPRLVAFVAEQAGTLLGYATCSAEVSTWEAREFLHLDCLYLRDSERGSGIGRLLVEAVIAEARDRGLTELRWQTPEWNVDAARFYDRLGGTSALKRRYALSLSPLEPGSLR